MAGISEGEVAVYDRQLRLWGVEAQQRLLQSKVLVWGLEGSNIEVCKNLVLAGVSVTVRDHRVVQATDVDFNYFLRVEDVGKNRAECAACRFQEMNPLSTVGATVNEPEQDAGGMASSLRGIHIVIVGLGVLGWNTHRAITLDEECRKAKVGLFVTASAGELAFFAADLGEHTVMERTTAQGAGPSSDEEKAADNLPETLSFPPLREWFESSPSALQQGKVDDSFVLVTLVASFLHSEGASEPDPAARFEAFVNKSLPSGLNVEGLADLKRAYALFFLEPLMHVASIVGGLLAQEVIKAITKRDDPFVNAVCFNAQTSTALVDRLPVKTAGVKRKAVPEEVLDLDD